MLKCWSANEHDRPTFSDIVRIFESSPIYDITKNYDVNFKPEFKSNLKFANSLDKSEFVRFEDVIQRGEYREVE